MATLIETETAEAQVNSAPTRSAFNVAARPPNYSRTEFLAVPRPQGTQRGSVLSDHLFEQLVTPALPPENKHLLVRRQISPASGRALEKLGHAIEYLTDEYAFETAVSGSVTFDDSALQSIQLLKSLNRRIYFECSIIAPLSQRIFSRLFPERLVPGAR